MCFIDNKIQIDYELKFVQLFNYEVIGPDASNRWIIIDENENNVGYIQKKKIYSKNEKKNLPAVYGYITNINSDLLRYSNMRKIKPDDDVPNCECQYEFDIKVSEVEYDHVYLNLGSTNPSITVWSDSYGYANFSITNQNLFINFKSETDNYNIEETITIMDTKTDSSYSYQIGYCEKNSVIHTLSSTSIEFKKSKCSEDVPLTVRQLEFKNKKLVDEYKTECEGDIKNEIFEYGMESLSHFKYIMNKIIPTDTSIIELISSLVQGKKSKLISSFLKCSKNKVKVLNKN